MEEIRIRCPKCEWEPSAYSIWYCVSCDFEWNTFDTGGKCPGCSHVHKHTQCISCHKFSNHEDWYEGLGDNLDFKVNKKERILSYFV